MPSLATVRPIPILSGLFVFSIFIAASEFQTFMPSAAWSVAALACLMAIWWATEAVPVAVTALLPLVVLPLLGVGDLREFAAGYSHPLIFLFLGAFILALGIEITGLHRRIALFILTKVGTEGTRLIGGFMFIAAILSMGMTNTSTTMMLLPIALSVVKAVSEREDLDQASKRNFGIALLLGVAFGATIGGMATLIGTPPNALVAAFVAEQYSIEIGFTQWLMIGLPISLFLLPSAWWVLTRWAFKVRVSTNSQVDAMLSQARSALPPVSPAERRIATVFVLVVLCWVFRPMIVDFTGLDFLSDAVIALIGAVSLFVIPAGGAKREALMSWEKATTIPWAVLLLFGGGLSLASAVSSSGLAVWLGETLTPVSVLGPFVLTLVVTFTVVYLTELTSNLATTATFLPIVASIAAQIGMDPLLLCIPVALAASCAFMLPVATAPNAIVFSSNYFRVADMAKAGMRLNIISGLFVTIFCYSIL